MTYKNCPDCGKPLGADGDIHTCTPKAQPATQSTKEFDDCEKSPTGKHSSSWYCNHDCEHCNSGSVAEPLLYVEVSESEPATQPDMKDAYVGAREDMEIWKRRALEAEALNRKFIAEVNGPTHMGEPVAQPATQPTCKPDLQVWVIPGGQFSWSPQDERFWTRMVPATTSQPAGEPVAWMYEINGKKHVTFTDQRAVEKTHPHFDKSVPLFTTPQPRKLTPLTDEQIQELSLNHKFDSRITKFVRIIEAAHGIGGQA